MSNFAVSNKPADGLALLLGHLAARISVGKVLTKFYFKTSMKK